MDDAKRSTRRLEVVAGHLSPVKSAHLRLCGAKSDGKSPKRETSSDYQRTAVVGSIPKKRQELLKWNGWGYEGTKIDLDNGRVVFHGGERYSIGEIYITDYIREWVKRVLNVTMENASEKFDDIPMPKNFPQSIIDQGFFDWLKHSGIQYSLDGEDRFVRAHGQTVPEMASLKGIPSYYDGKHKPHAAVDASSMIPRIPDIVVWPEKHDDVVKLVKAANETNVVLIPIGGATNITRAINCSPEEGRMIVAVDTLQMNHILWVDQHSLLICVEAGIIGQDLERELNSRGLTTGHEPDSYEFSSLGGWVATRASGMKKNLYGNIEDIVVHVKMVTPTGVLQKSCRVPRISCGPDLNHLILGSEGTLGLVTEVILKVRPMPERTECGSIVFPDLESGVSFLREVARQRCQPASLRLMDNEQYKMGQLFKEYLGVIGSVIESAKMLYLTKIKGFDIDKMCISILVFEGSHADTIHQQKIVYSIATKNGGIVAGHRNGKRGYKLTYTIAYLRDFLLSYSILAESFETSVPWDKTLTCCRNVKYRISQECKAWNLKHFVVSCRVTQVYDAGSCVYFYFGFNARDFAENRKPGDPPVNLFEFIHLLETKAREEVLASGGSISHHHGVGKIRQQWYETTVSTPGLEAYRAVKKKLDPNNVFASRNIDEEAGKCCRLPMESSKNAEDGIINSN